MNQHIDGTSETPTHELSDVNPAELGPSGAAIEMIEQLKLGDPHARVEVLLVALGEKPATAYTFKSSRGSDGKIPEAEYEAFVEAIQAAGLSFEIGPDRHVDPTAEVFKGSDGALRADASDPEQTTPATPEDMRTWRTVYLAATPDGLESMIAAYDANDFEQLGACYGFPETSTQAYGSKQAISPHTLEGQDPHVLAFAQFGLSPDHWRDELQTAKRWANAVKTASPRLYQETTESFDPNAN